MNKKLYVNNILADAPWDFKKNSGLGYAPSNIALSKYWGKRNTELNLPVTDSVSISLNELGTSTAISLSNQAFDQVILNEDHIAVDQDFHKRVIDFLDLFRLSPDCFFVVDTTSFVPVAAGLASSASGFAALTLALDDLFGWGLDKKDLSKLSRLGSGSAARSLWHGFVKWDGGQDLAGADCYAYPLDVIWDDLCVGVLPVSFEQKALSSTRAMNSTVRTSPLYGGWAQICDKTCSEIVDAIEKKDFSKLGVYTELSASKMHEMIEASQPRISFSKPKTKEYINSVLGLRQNHGVEIYYTQDAGPNVKVLFLKENLDEIKNMFSEMIVVQPFDR